MNKIDIQILRLLEADGRISFSELAQAVGLSKTPCWNRVKELKRAGIIKGYTATLDEHALGLEIHALVHVVVNFALSQEFEDAVNLHKNILTCYAVTGDYDYMLKVIAPSIADIDKVLRKELSSIPGVERFSTAIATRTIKNHTSLSMLI